MKSRLIVILLILSIPFPASAEINRRNLWIVLGLAPVGFFHETLMHETAHVTTAKLMIPGMEVARFSPYPCRVDGQFYFGYNSVTWPENVTVGPRTHTAIDIAPYALSASAFIVSDVLLSTKAVNPKGPGGAVLYTLGMIAPYVNYAVGILHGSDWDKIRARPYGVAFDVVGLALLAVGTYRIVKQGFAVIGR